jgi:hypothetical protein
MAEGLYFFDRLERDAEVDDFLRGIEEEEEEEEEWEWEWEAEEE